jgi:hypothetical protein
LDPVSLDKLLSIADAIETRHNDLISLFSLHKIIAAASKARNRDRRTRDVLRVLLELGWLAVQDKHEFQLTDGFTRFITAWNDGTLPGINRCLTAYQPYALFLACLLEEGAIRIPRRQNKGARKELGRRLKAEYDITFVAFDTFRTWAVAVGQAYLSPFEESLYWGGNWNDSAPPLEIFKAACWQSYHEAEKTSGYANIGRLADAVCRQLKISFQAFEINMKILLEAEPGLVKLARATIREPSRGFQITTIRPRSEILKERLAARLRGVNESSKPQVSI